MLPQIPTLVRGVDDDGVLGKARFIKGFEQRSHRIIDAGDAAKIVLCIPLVLPPNEIITLESERFKRFVSRLIGGLPGSSIGFAHLHHPLRHLKLEIDWPQVLTDGHLLEGRSLRSAGVIIKERCRLGEILAFEVMQVSGPRHPFTMWSLVLDHEDEGLCRISLILEPVDRQIGDEIGDVAFGLDAFTISDHGGSVIEALPDQSLIVVEPNRLTLEVPLADQRRLIPGLLGEGRKRWLSSIELLGVRGHSMKMTEGPCENRGTTWRTDGILDEVAIEDQSFPSDAVDVRGGVSISPVLRNGLPGMVVGHDEQDVWAFIGRRSEQREEDKDQRWQHDDSYFPDTTV